IVADILGITFRNVTVVSMHYLTTPYLRYPQARSGRPMWEVSAKCGQLEINNAVSGLSCYSRRQLGGGLIAAHNTAPATGLLTIAGFNERREFDEQYACCERAFRAARQNADLKQEETLDVTAQRCETIWNALGRAVWLRPSRESG